MLINRQHPKAFSNQNRSDSSRLSDVSDPHHWLTQEEIANVARMRHGMHNSQDLGNPLERTGPNTQQQEHRPEGASNHNRVRYNVQPVINLAALHGFESGLL